MTEPALNAPNAPAYQGGGRAIARMAVSAATFAIDKPYDYVIPAELRDKAVPGIRAIVPFGRGNKKKEAVILSVEPSSEYANLKEINELLDDTPVLDEETIKLALWMSDRFFCTVFEALRAMLPAGMWFKDGVQRQRDKTVAIASLGIDPEEAKIIASQRRKRAPQQAAVLEFMADAGSMPVKDIVYHTGAPAGSVTALARLGALTLEEREVYRRPPAPRAEDKGPITLNDEQIAAYSSILPMLRGGAPAAALLHGVTGSGKTMVYIKLIEETLSMGKTAIVLVPEIALTPQMVAVFTQHFGDSVAVLHSALGTGERYDEWKRIRTGAVRVVVGTRSAVFAPLENIGLIVLDEEQEHTYKSESSPRYHAREVAKYRVTRAGALLLMSSATPSVESMHNARIGKYSLFSIANRYNEMELPPVIITDMKEELKDGNAGILSYTLRAEIESNLLAGEQSILFVNRRGTSPLVTCGHCGYVFRCERCSVPMTYHSANGRMLCHYCGYSLPLPPACPDCDSSLRFVGAGTQKVEAELLEIFPDASVIRMDADSVSRLNSHEKLLSKFREGGAQILLGTQMVTKGLDFENVTLAGVLSADSMLYMSDYRAYEKAFSLITQVIGRSGRGGKQGRAVIQTFNPRHEIVLLASRQDYDGFYERELALRETLGSPPVRDLISLAVSGLNEMAVISACSALKEMLLGYFRGARGVKILGPAPAYVAKVNNRFRYRLLISCDNNKKVRQTVAHVMRLFTGDIRSRGVTVFADTDPYD
ncbi:MAG: primosomal protein N' [Oscillospiraceae bacterium]|nr:primosomal protein N' [Oscillospiraceae bacterium]